MKKNNYQLNKADAISEIMSMFRDDFKVASLAETARLSYCIAKNKHIEDSLFPMLGSMGQEISMGLGLALGVEGKTTKRSVVITSDGSFLSNINSFATIATLKPKNFFIILLDNEMHGITGGQPTATANMNLVSIANACGFTSFLVSDIEELRQALKQSIDEELIFLQIKINEEIFDVSSPSGLPEIFRVFSNFVRQDLTE